MEPSGDMGVAVAATKPLIFREIMMFNSQNLRHDLGITHRKTDGILIRPDE